MARPRKIEVQNVEFVEPTEVQDVVVKEDNPQDKHSVNIKALRAVLFNTKLEVMQETAVKAVLSGDDLTMQALESVLSATNSGIASQYLQQIIQRNS